MKKLYKGKDKKIFGVCSGIAEYFNVDATIIRLLAIFLLFTGSGLLAYLIAAVIIPENPDNFN